MTSTARWLLCAVMIFGALGCKKKPLTEEQRYAKLQKKVKFKAYKKLSGKALPPLVAAYNFTQSKESGKVPPYLCRLVLGYTWMVNVKPPFTIAEGQLITEDRSTPRFGRALGHLALSLGLHGAGLKRLARREKDKGIDTVTTKDQREQTDQVLAIGYALLALHALRGKKLGQAVVFLRGFDTVTGIGWPVPVVQVLADVQDKKLQSALIRAKKLSRNEEVPKPIRVKLAKLVTALEKKGGPVESELFWPRLLSRVLLDEMRKSPKIRGVFSITDKIEKRATSVPKPGIKKKVRKLIDRIRN